MQEFWINDRIERIYADSVPLNLFRVYNLSYEFIGNEVESNQRKVYDIAF